MTGRTSVEVIAGDPDIRFRRHEVVVRRVDDAVVLPKPSDRSALVLRGAAQVIWDSLRQLRSTAELAALMAGQRPDRSPSECADEVAQTTKVLIEEGLISAIAD